MTLLAEHRKASIYDSLGGAEGIQKLVNTFCDVLETTEVGRPIHLLHLRGHGMAHARMEQFNFFFGYVWRTEALCGEVGAFQCETNP